MISIDDKITLRCGDVIKNRILKSAMSEQLGRKDYNPSEKLIRLYRSWAEGGVGISVTGNVMIDRKALGEPCNVVLDEKSDHALFRKWAEEGKKNNTMIWMQLNHPGKQSPSFLSKEPVAPSAVPLGRGLSKAFNTPRALNENEIMEIIDKFAQSAFLAKETGFSGVQIHGAHGYLVSQFLSPHHNRRDDNWGGSLENRSRFVLEIYRAIREKVGKDYPVGIKMNSSDFRNGGFSIEDAVKVAQLLDKEGIDLIEISGGSYENPNMMGGKDSSEGYFKEYASEIKSKVDAPVVLTGGFRSSQGIRNILKEEIADIAGVARPFAVDPYFADKIIKESGYSVDLPRVSTGFKGIDAMVMIGLTWYEYQIYRIGKGKKPDMGKSAWNSVLLTFLRLGTHSFRKRRVKE